MNITKLFRISTMAVIVFFFTLSARGQTAFNDSSTLSFFVATTQFGYPQGRVSYLASFSNISGDTTGQFNLTPVKGLPAINRTTHYHSDIMAYSPATGNTNEVYTYDFQTGENKLLAALPFTPRSLTSDAMSVFAAANQIVRIKEQGTVDTAFKPKFGSNLVCWGLQATNTVLYALMGAKSNNLTTLYAIHPISGKIMGSIAVGGSSAFVIRGNSVALSERYFDSWNPSTNATTIRILQLSETGTTVTFSQVGANINQEAMAINNLTFGRGGALYAVYQEGKMAKIRTSTATIDTIVTLQAGLPQMTIPRRIFTFDHYAIIFMQENGGNDNSQIVLTDLDTLTSPITVIEAHNTGKEIRGILQFNPKNR